MRLPCNCLIDYLNITSFNYAIFCFSIFVLNLFNFLFFLFAEFSKTQKVADYFGDVAKKFWP